ncbi:hypothetical protein DYB31_012917 [Aphanomyces astaci]|uniref:DDE-1 domain-containing protein n=1 Tax=Aphanomyces astaci TaxID=112090 RepID=A0A397FK46_APHAT|nr:hypothetical protein DYB31_012917 [Aphanomyces astaci]
MITWIKVNQREWLFNYLATKKPDAAYNSLLKILQRFCKCHGFSRQRPTKNKLKKTVPAEVAAEFTGDFHHEYASYFMDCVFNVDEPGMYYDLPPSYIWASRGGNSKIFAGEKHSMYKTVVLTVRADGTKLPLMCIMRGTPGSRIESSEFPTFPSEHWRTSETGANFILSRCRLKIIR